MNNDYRITKGKKIGLVIKGSDEEVKIVKWFSEFFGVTFSKEGRFKQNDYNFHFLQPDEMMQRNFNLSNEILLLFSSYPSFDTRTFDLIDKTLGEYSNRLDKLCVFVVSNDSNFIQRISKLVADQKDFRLVVPFIYEEILNNKLTISDLLERMRDYLYSRDLFAFESPLQKDDYFYGRNHVVQKLYHKYSSGEQSGLFGLRKIGKTSVLYALQRTIELRDGISIYIDCQNPTFHMSRWYQLLEHLIIRLATDFDKEKLFKNMNFTELNAAELFERNLNLLYKYLGNHRILFIFDEIENITFDISTQEHWKTGNDYLYFWQTIRSVFQSNNHIFAFVIAGVNPYIIEKTTIKSIDNPIFSMLSPIYLDFFKLQDVKQMVSSIGGYMGIAFDEEIYTYLVEDYGGHPFLIRQVCSIINSSITKKPYQVEKFTYKSNKLEYDKKISPYVNLITNVLKDWYPNELELLSVLANHGNIRFQKHVSNQTEINHLLGYGVLAEKNNNYHITINAILEYLKTINNSCVPEQLSEKWAVISKRRNSIEKSLRNIIKITLESSKGKATAKNLVLGTIDQVLREKVRSETIDSILESNLFFNQLKQIIESNWSLFSNLFNDKITFSMCMDTINKNRIDAHAKNISDEQYFQLNFALNWIDEKIM